MTNITRTTHPLRRTAVSVAAAMTIALIASQAQATTTITSNTASVDASGAAGLVINSGVTIGTLSNSGSDINPTGDGITIDSNATVTNQTNGTGPTSAIEGLGTGNGETIDGNVQTFVNQGNLYSASGAGLLINAGGTLTTLQSSGSISGSIGIENLGNVGSIELQSGSYTAGTTGPGVESVPNLTADNGSMIVGNGAAAVLFNTTTVNATLNGIVEGQGTADGVEDNIVSTTSETAWNEGVLSTDTINSTNGTFETNGSGAALAIVSSGTGVGALSIVNLNGSTVQANGSGSALTVGADGSTVGAEVTLTNGSFIDTTSTSASAPAAIYVGQNAVLLLSVDSTSAAGVSNPTTSTAPAIEVAGVADLQIKGGFGNGNPGGVAIQIDPTGALSGGGGSTMDGDAASVSAVSHYEGGVFGFDVQGFALDGGNVYGAIVNNGVGALGVQGVGAWTTTPNSPSLNTLTNLLTGGAYGQATITNENSALSFDQVLLDDNIEAGSQTVTIGNDYGTFNASNTAPQADLALFESVNITAGNVVVSNNALIDFLVQNGAAATGTTSDSGYGRITVNGNLTLGSGVRLVLFPLDGGVLQAGQKYLVFVVNGTANFNTSAITAAAVGYAGTVTATVVNGGQGLQIVLGTASSTGTGGTSSTGTGGTSSTGTGGTSSTGTGGTTGTTTPTAPSTPSTPVTPTAPKISLGVTLNPAGASNVVGVQTNGVVLDDVEQQLHTDHADAGHGLNLWGKAFGGASQLDGFDSGFGGAMIGGDKRIGASGWRVGAALALGSTRISGNGVSVSNTSLTGVGYADWTGPKNVYVDAMIAVGGGRNSESRSIDGGAAAGSYSDRTVAARLTGGRSFIVGHDVRVTPFAGVDVAHIASHGAVEQDAGTGTGVDLPSSSLTSAKSDIGVKIDKTFGQVDAWASVSEVHEFAGRSSSSSAPLVDDGSYTYTLTGADLARNMGRIAVGAVVAKAKGLTLSAQLSVSAGSGERDEEAEVKLVKSW